MSVGIMPGCVDVALDEPAGAAVAADVADVAGAAGAILRSFACTRCRGTNKLERSAAQINWRRRD